MRSIGFGVAVAIVMVHLLFAEDEETKNRIGSALITTVSNTDMLMDRCIFV